MKRGQTANLVAVMTVFVAVKEARGETNPVFLTESRYIALVFARIRRHVNYVKRDCI